MKIACNNCGLEHDLEDGGSAVCDCGTALTLRVEVTQKAGVKRASKTFEEITIIKEELEREILGNVDGMRRTKSGIAIVDVVRANPHGTYQVKRNGKARAIFAYATQEGTSTSVYLGTLGDNKLPGEERYMELLKKQSRMIFLKRKLKGDDLGKMAERWSRTGRLITHGRPKKGKVD